MKQKQKNFIHDSFFKEVFSKTKYALGLFRLILTKAEFELFDWNTLKSEATTFIDKKGMEKRTDLQFSVYTKDSKEPVTIVFLLEHKSYQDHKALLQILGYQTGIYEQMADNVHFKTKVANPPVKGRKLAPVLPILVNQSKDKEWKGALEFQDDLFWTEELKKRFGQNVINFRPRVLNIPALDIKQMLDLSGLEIKKEERGLTALLALYILKHIWRLDKAKVREFFVLSKGMSIEDRKFLVDKVAMYIQEQDPSFSWRLLQEIEEEVIPEKEGRVMSLLQYTLEKERKKGQQEGWQKGQQEGQQALILKLINNGLDVQTICKGTGLSQDEIKKLKNGSSLRG